MNNDLPVQITKSEDESINRPGRPHTEDLYSVNNYACMYYVMTPMGCSLSSNTKSWTNEQQIAG
jgi:hypothetical protein